MKISKHNSIVLSIALAISVFMFHTGRKDPTRFTSRVFHSFSGWGYDILVDEKILIHQELIPALNGNTGFLQKEQAEQAARTIINKMKRGEPPTMTTFETRQIYSGNEMNNAH